MVELTDVGTGNRSTLAVDAPCDIDYTADPNRNGTPGPIVMTTEASTAIWTTMDGSVSIEATGLSFRLFGPDIRLSTAGAYPTCTWLQVPRLTFDLGQ